MAENTKIEWADHTFNPWIGCTRVGPGCGLAVGPGEPEGAGCYAEALAERWNMAEWGPGKTRKRTSEANWKNPLKWQRGAAAFAAQHHRRQRVFCASLADVFDNEVDWRWRLDLFGLIRDTPDLDWLLLTKRIGNVPDMLDEIQVHGTLAECFPNVWLGATITTQKEADRDIPKLLEVPAAKRFLSMEPLLGPVDLNELGVRHECRHEEGYTEPDTNALVCRRCEEDGPSLDWILVGGESGGLASRPMHPDWARSLRDQCRWAYVPFLFKQWGDWLPRSQVQGTKMRVSQFAGGRTMELDGETFLHAGKKWSGRKLDGATITETPV